MLEVKWTHNKTQLIIKTKADCKLCSERWGPFHITSSLMKHLLLFLNRESVGGWPEQYRAVSVSIAIKNKNKVMWIVYSQMCPLSSELSVQKNCQVRALHFSEHWDAPLLSCYSHMDLLFIVNLCHFALIFIDHACCWSSLHSRLKIWSKHNNIIASGSAVLAHHGCNKYLIYHLFPGS